MITTTLPIGKFFELLEKYEKLSFTPEQEQYINSPIQIKNEEDEWINVSAAITKNDSGLMIRFDNGDMIKGAKKHLIFNGALCVYLESLDIGDEIVKSNGEIIKVSEITEIDDTVFYDLSVDSDTHLYQSANGIIHHNTETSKALAKHLGVKLLRFDMSEYQEKHSISKLIGSPPGYVGFEDNAGLLITQIQENPNAILLLDEIEKSHPDVSTVLLQIMDNGFVTGSNGKQADCRNLIVIMTTNAGSQESSKNNIGFGKQEKDYSHNELNKFFTPEFRNRLDGIITFNPLSKESMTKIVDKFINELSDQVKPKGIKVKITKDATNWLIEKGFDPKMGARPLQRVIDKEIKRDLSKQMLFGDLKDGGMLTITVVDDKIVLSSVPKKPRIAKPVESILIESIEVETM